MNFKTINVIISREYMTRVRKKSFLVTTILGPIFFAAMCILPTLILMFAKEDAKSVAVVDESGIVIPYFADSETVTYTDMSSADMDSLKAGFDGLGFDALIHISPVDAERSVSVEAYSPKPLSVEMKETIGSRVEEAVEDYRLEAYDIGNLKQIMEDVKADISVATYILGEEGEEKITSSEVYMIISLVLSMIIYMFIAMFSGMVMQSVIEEKSSRVVEVLVSSVKSTELMFGKIIGVACVALTQFFLWVVLTIVLVSAASAFIGFDSMLASSQAQTEMMQMPGMDMDTMDAAAMAQQIQTSGDSEMNAVVATLLDLDYGMIILSFVIYFALGYLLYASLFAAIGSAVENEADTQQLQMPVTIPLLLAFLIAFYAFRAPDSQIVFWGSMIPFTSPIVMLARIPFGVPAWELALSIGLLVLTFVFIAYISAKIYKVGILMFGKKSTFKDLYRWLRQR